MNEMEFALRELVVSIENVMRVVDNDPFAYDLVPDSLHHAILTLMREIEQVDWEAV